MFYPIWRACHRSLTSLLRQNSNLFYFPHHPFQPYPHSSEMFNSLVRCMNIPRTLWFESAFTGGHQNGNKSVPDVLSGLDGTPVHTYVTIMIKIYGPFRLFPRQTNTSPKLLTANPVHCTLNLEGTHPILYYAAHDTAMVILRTSAPSFFLSFLERFFILYFRLQSLDRVFPYFVILS